MDYRYETKDDARDFHRQRKAFVIIDGKLEFLPESSLMSHFEYCQMKGINKEAFNEITRGFYLDGKLMFYKDNFVYDKKLGREALSHLDEIVTILNINDFDIYFGLLPEENFTPDFYYGKYINGKIKHNHY